MTFGGAVWYTPRFMRSKKLTANAPGKVNLFLEVLDRRPDGYHDVKSLMVHVSLCDKLVFELTSGEIKTTVTIGDIPAWWGRRQLLTDGNNLTTRAAIALRKATGYRGGARIHVEKRIPICGGMGGGSSDAAATLRVLNQLWGTGLSIEELCRIASGLGSDVPAMVLGGWVVLEGMGERVTPVRMIESDLGTGGPGWHIVVVNPGFCVPTRDVCARYRLALTSRRGQFKRMVCAAGKQDMEAIRCGLFNSLEGTVFEKYPLLAMIAMELEKAGARGVLLCGSGASLFALADSKSQACAIAGEIGRTMGSWLWAKVAEILPDGVTAAHGPLEARV